MGALGCNRQAKKLPVRSGYILRAPSLHTAKSEERLCGMTVGALGSNRMDQALFPFGSACTVTPHGTNALSLPIAHPKDSFTSGR